MLETLGSSLGCFPTRSYHSLSCLYFSSENLARRGNARGLSCLITKEDLSKSSLFFFLFSLTNSKCLFP